jgi:uncharacterized protein
MYLRIGIFYVLTWLFLILLSVSQEATGILPPQIGLAQWGPGLAALLMLVIFKKDGIKIRIVSKNTPLLRYLLAALIPAGVGLVVYLVRRLVPMAATQLPDVYDQLWLVLLWSPLGALGEEIGWRGYLQQKLNTRFRGLVSSIIVALLWLPIHLTFLSQSPILIFFLMVWFISLSIVIYALVQDIGFNVLVATIFHTSVNFINLLVIDVIYDSRFWMINGSLWAIVALFFVLRNRGVFFEKEREKKIRAL